MREQQILDVLSIFQPCETVERPFHSETTDHPIIILFLSSGERSYSSRIIEVVESLLLLLLLFFLCPRCSPSNPVPDPDMIALREEKEIGVKVHRLSASRSLIRRGVSLSESSNRFSHPRGVHRTHVSHAMQTPLLRASISRFSQGGRVPPHVSPSIFFLRRYSVTPSIPLVKKKKRKKKERKVVFIQLAYLNVRSNAA